MPKYVSDKDFPKDNKNRMVPMKNGKIYSEIFPDGSVHSEQIRQNAPATCWIVGTLRSLAANNPDMIRRMFTDNGDGTVTIHFNPLHVTVGDITIDKTLPPTDSESPDWVRLLEKGLAAAEVYVGKAEKHPAISMDNLNWGHVQMLLGFIDSSYTGENPDVTGILSESNDKEELVSKFKDFCKHVMENEGAVMIQTPKHNMPVKNIDDDFIYYVEQLTGKSYRVGIESLFDEKSGIESLLFSLQGDNMISIAPYIEPKVVLKNMGLWHNDPNKKENEKNCLELVRDRVKNILDDFDFNCDQNYKKDIDMFGLDYNTNAFVRDDQVIKKIFKDSGAKNYAEFHKQLRTDINKRQEIVNTYFDFLKDNVNKLNLKKYNLTDKQLKESLVKWKDMNQKHPEYVKRREEFLENFENLRFYKNKTPYIGKETHNEEIRNQEAYSRQIGEILVSDQNNIRKMDTLYRNAKSWSSSFSNSEQWKYFRHSLHIMSNLSKVADKMKSSLKKKVNYGEGRDEIFKRQLETSTFSIAKLDSTVADYVNDYCKEHRIEESKHGIITYAHLCEILGSSCKEARSDAERYEKYKMKKFELPLENHQPGQNNAHKKKNVVRNTPSKDDLRKLEIVGSFLNKEIKIPGYNPDEKKKTGNAGLVKKDHNSGVRVL